MISVVSAFNVRSSLCLALKEHTYQVVKIHTVDDAGLEQR